jgi:hypothetical protein
LSISYSKIFTVTVSQHFVSVVDASTTLILEVIDCSSLNSGGQQKPDLALYILNRLSYDKMSTVKVVDLRKTDILVLNILS